MITRDLYTLTNPDPDWEGFANTSTLARCTEWKGSNEGWVISLAPHCQCCGSVAGLERYSNGQARCPKHLGRNPCAIEGCKRTQATQAGHYADSAFLCSEHWRRYCPPRSAARRVYRRFFRIARRDGWTKPLRIRFYRFWDGLIKRARRQNEGGHIDMDEVARVMDW